MVSSFVLPEEISQRCSSPKEQLLVLLLAKLLKSRHTWASWNLTFSIKKGWSQDHWPCRKRREVRDSWALPFSCSLRCYRRNIHDLQWRTMPGITWLLERHAVPSLTHLPSQLEHHEIVTYGASTTSSSNRSQPHRVHFENLCIRVFCSCVLPIKAEPGC